MEELIKVFECKYFNINLYQIKNNDKYKINLIKKNIKSIYNSYFDYIGEYLQSNNLKKDVYTYNEVIKYIETILNEQEFKKFIDSKIINKQQSLINDIDSIINKFNMNSLSQIKEQPKEPIQLKEKEPVKKIIDDKKPDLKEKKQSKKQSDDGPIKINTSFIDSLFDDIDNIYSQCKKDNVEKPKIMSKPIQKPISKPISTPKPETKTETKPKPEKENDYEDISKDDIMKMVKNIIGQINDMSEKKGFEKLDVKDDDIHIIPIRFDSNGNFSLMKDMNSPKQENLKPLSFKEPTQKGTTYNSSQYKQPIEQDKSLSKDDIEKMLADALNSLF